MISILLKEGHLRTCANLLKIKDPDESISNEDIVLMLWYGLSTTSNELIKPLDIIQSYLQDKLANSTPNLIRFFESNPKFDFPIYTKSFEYFKKEGLFNVIFQNYKTETKECQTNELSELIEMIKENTLIILVDILINNPLYIKRIILNYNMKPFKIIDSLIEICLNHQKNPNLSSSCYSLVCVLYQDEIIKKDVMISSLSMFSSMKLLEWMKPSLLKSDFIQHHLFKWMDYSNVIINHHSKGLNLDCLLNVHLNAKLKDKYNDQAVEYILLIVVDYFSENDDGFWSTPLKKEMLCKGLVKFNQNVTNQMLARRIQIIIDLLNQSIKE